MHDTHGRMELLDKQGFCIHISTWKVAGLHGHKFLEFTYIERGMIEHSFGERVEILKEGDYFIVDYGTQHRYRSVGNGKLSVINLLFYPNFIDRTLGRWDNFEKVVNSYLIRFKYRSLNISPAGVAFHDDDGVVYGIIKSLLREYDRQDTGYLEYIRCLIAQILIITMRKISKSDDDTKEDGVIKDITDTVKRDHAERLSLSELAKKYNYSVSHISKKFTEEMGIGFTQYLQRIRIEHACGLLEKEDLTINEIASAVGYSNIKFFNKVFKAALGVTPREFRKMQQHR